VRLLRRRQALANRRIRAIDRPLGKHRVDLRKHRVSLTKPPRVRPVLPPPRGPVGPVRRIARRGAAATRAWARRPGGRLILPGLLMLLLVAAMTATGAVLPRAAGAEHPPDSSAAPGADLPEPPDGEDDAADGDADDDDPDDPNDPEDLPPLDPDAGPDPGERSTEALATWAAPMSVRTGVPVVALQAYALAELTVAQRIPGCNLRWPTLAGIGLVESNHGRGAGATLLNDGRAIPPIFGAPLDGQGGRRAIADTDGGRFDNDRTWDRAMGPMQFIPSTWARYAADGDGDGDTNPHDIDDAALAAATYLCAGGRNLSTANDWWSAILSYNNVETYVRNVYAAANDYGLRSRP